MHALTSLAGSSSSFRLQYIILFRFFHINNINKLSSFSSIIITLIEVEVSIYANQSTVRPSVRPAGRLASQKLENHRKKANEAQNINYSYGCCLPVWLTAGVGSL